MDDTDADTSTAVDVDTHAAYNNVATDITWDATDDDDLAAIVIAADADNFTAVDVYAANADDNANKDMT